MSRFYLIKADGTEEDKASLAAAQTAAAVNECVHICGHDTNPPKPCYVINKAGKKVDTWPTVSVGA